MSMSLADFGGSFVSCIGHIRVSGLMVKQAFGMFNTMIFGRGQKVLWKTLGKCLVIWFGLVACSSAQEEAENEKKRAKEEEAAAKQAELEAYMDAASDVHARFDEYKVAFTGTLEACRATCELDKHREDFEGKVLPAFAAVMDGLGSMPTKSEALTSVHKKLLGAYHQYGTVLANYPKGLTADNRSQRLEDLTRKLSTEITEAEKVYRSELKSFCSMEPEVDCKPAVRD